MDLSELVFIDETGYHFASYPDFLQWRQDQLRAIYGADIYLEPDSQDGQLVSVQAQADYDTAALGASVYNSFSPQFAQGVGLSTRVAINGVRRKTPSFSTVPLILVGQNGTLIENGIAQDVLGQNWIIPTTTIPGGGTITVDATAEVVGLINAEANTITKIFTPTLGWQSVNNAVAATPGAAVESDAELRIRQAQSVADPSLTVFEGTLGGVANVEGVTKVRGYENDTGSNISLPGATLPAHSICVVVSGGTDQDVADEIMVHKTPGTQTFGDTTVLTYDSHGQPLNINFQRSVTATIDVEVTIHNLPGFSTDFENQIKIAVAAVINLGRIGDDVILTKLYSPAYLNGAPQGQTYDVISIVLSKNGTPVGGNVSLDFDEQPVCDPNTNVIVSVS